MFFPDDAVPLGALQRADLQLTVDEFSTFLR
jgi:hypothetical protein